MIAASFLGCCTYNANTDIHKQNMLPKVGSINKLTQENVLGNESVVRGKNGDQVSPDAGCSVRRRANLSHPCCTVRNDGPSCVACCTACLRSVGVNVDEARIDVVCDDNIKDEKNAYFRKHTFGKLNFSVVVFWVPKSNNKYKKLNLKRTATITPKTGKNAAENLTV